MAAQSTVISQSPWLIPKTGTRNLTSRMLAQGVTRNRVHPNKPECPHSFHERPKTWQFVSNARNGIDPSLEGCSPAALAMRLAVPSLPTRLFESPNYRFITLIRDPFERLVRRRRHPSPSLILKCRLVADLGDGRFLSGPIVTALTDWAVLRRFILAPRCVSKFELVPGSSFPVPGAPLPTLLTRPLALSTL